MKLNFTFYSLLVFLLFSFAASGQWTNNTSLNTEVSTAIGKQVDCRILDDGKGGSFIAWKDYRAGGGFGPPDVYIQYLDKYGYRQWDTNGVALCTNSADQSTPNITTDMTGGAIVTWSDWRSGIERDIYAQRVDSLGVIQWTLDGVGVANKSNREHNEKIVSDGAGGAIIVWEQQGASGWDVWAQRINHSGVAMWAIGGIPLCTVFANRLNPKVQKDGAGGCFIVWQDFRTADYNIFGQHVNSSGTLLWGVNALQITSAPDAQIDPKIDPDSVSGGIYVTWIDKRNFIDYDIYAQRIDSTGNILWANNGVPVVTAANNQSAQDMLSTTSTNGIIVAWKDFRFGSWDLFAQKISPAGVAQWMLDGISICTSSYDQLNPNIITDHEGGAIICWQDSLGLDWNIRTQRIDGNGNALWLANGVDVSIATGEQSGPKNVSDGIGGSIYCWMDKRSGVNDIYAHHLFWNGTTVNTTVVSEIHPVSEISVYPNPFSTHAKVNFQNSKATRLDIVDVLGRKIKSYAIANGISTLTIDRNELNAGFYFLKLIETNKIISIEKIIVQD